MDNTGMDELIGGSVVSSDSLEMVVEKNGKKYVVRTDINYEMPFMYIDANETYMYIRRGDYRV
jgi:hypothetical protein